MLKVTVVAVGKIKEKFLSAAIDEYAKRLSAYCSFEIIEVKDESDIDSLFSAGGTSALSSKIAGLDDFELICFFIVRKEE